MRGCALGKPTQRQWIRLIMVDRSQFGAMSRNCRPYDCIGVEVGSAEFMHESADIINLFLKTLT